MAIRQLHYCTHCGVPLLGGDPKLNFCPSCGHRLPRTPALIPRRPPLRVAAPPSPQPTVTAPVERRAAAAVVDLLLAGIATLVAWALGAEISVILNGAGRGAHHGSLLAWSVVVLVLVGYQPLFWARSGQTPGMQLLGIRLVSASGRRVRAGLALLRTGAMALSALALGAGFAGAWRDAEGRTWHDRMAHTKVVAAPR